MLTTIYTSLVQSYLTYGFLGWGAAAKTTLKPLKAKESRYSKTRGTIKIQLNMLMYRHKSNTLPNSEHIQQ